MSRIRQKEQVLLQLRPYLLTVMLLLGAGLIISVGHRQMPSGFPWALIALLVVAAVATLWGGRPALLALVVAALFGDRLVPDLHISVLNDHPLLLQARIVRALLFAICGGVIIALAHQARTQRDDAERRRAVVQAMQSMVLPASVPAVPGFQSAGVYKPARVEEEVGGDFYDLFPLDAHSGRFGVLIGDVMGKGKEASASTALLRYSVRAYAGLGLSPGQVLTQLNALLDAQPSQMETATLFFGVLDSATGEIGYASAGHDPPLLRRADGGEEELKPTGPLLGVGASIPYAQGTLRLDPGDALLLLTDGVTESRSPEGEFLETEGAWRMLHQALRADTAEAALDTLQRAIADHSGQVAHDDIALLLLRRTGPTVKSGPGALSRAAARPA